MRCRPTNEKIYKTFGVSSFKCYLGQIDMETALKILQRYKRLSDN